MQITEILITERYEQADGQEFEIEFYAKPSDGMEDGSQLNISLLSFDGETLRVRIDSPQ